ncbi:MAG: FRG domain-containing protein [Nitrosopumilus sp.]|nr:MAG: FRG domain-containing protein [Nitrosopumilus sp.]
MKYVEEEIHNIAELLTKIETHTNSIKEPIWFRGHAKKDWDLIPSIFRDTKKREIDYLKEFKQDATLLVEPRPRKPYEWLFIMRHNHIPTRLLDWTESPLVATFFAVNDEKHIDEDGALWNLLPLELNRNVDLFENETTLPSFEEDEFLEAYTPEKFASAKPENQRKTLAFLAPRNSNRMQAQLSVFTINHYDKTSIEQIGDGNHLWKYIIPKEAKITLKKELDMLRINYFQLFPELPYIYEKIKG